MQWIIKQQPFYFLSRCERCGDIYISDYRDVEKRISFLGAYKTYASCPNCEERYNSAIKLSNEEYKRILSGDIELAEKILES